MLLLSARHSLGREPLSEKRLDSGLCSRVYLPRRSKEAMQIGVVAKKLGLSVDAIRFYERNSLLPRAARTQGGFRQYAESDVETLAFIRRVQGLGFKLSEIRSLLKLRGNRLQPCAPVRRRLQLTDLQSLERELRLA